MPRRANLQGTLRKDGRYLIRVDTLTATGERKRKPIYGKTKKEAQAKAHAFIYEEGRQIGTATTVQELADAWKASWKSSITDKTKTNYLVSLKHIEAGLGKQKLESLTVPIIHKFLSKLEGATHDAVRTRLGTMLKYGVLIGVIKSNPMRDYSTKRKAKKASQRITNQELDAILAELDPQYHPFILFLAATGLRPWREAIRTEKSWIGRAFDVDYVAVPDSKTVSGERVVPIDDQRVIAHIDSVESGKLFTIKQDAVDSAWGRAKTRAGIKDTERRIVTIYALRSFAISRWSLSRPLEEVQRLAGHSDLRLTQEVYNEVNRLRILIGRKGVNEGVTISELMGDKR